MPPKTALLASLLLLSVPAFALAADRFELSCDGDTFEVPMTITARDGVAKADVEFDMSGSAIISADYSGLAVIDLGGELTITQPVVAGRRPEFHVTLRKNAQGKLVGKLYALATDGTDLPYFGQVTCSFVR